MIRNIGVILARDSGSEKMAFRYEKSATVTAAANEPSARYKSHT